MHFTLIWVFDTKIHMKMHFANSQFSNFEKGISVQCLLSIFFKIT